MKRFGRSFIGMFLILSMVLAAFAGTAGSAFAGTSKPNVEGSAAVIYCATTDEIIFSKDAETQYNLASITKLMTCLLAVENLGLDFEVTVDAEAEKTVRERAMVYADEIIPVKDLVHEALMISANDAAKALAIAVAGSEEDFAVLMNERALQIGCTQTEFHNASGIAANGNVSTAHDIALIAQEALSNPDIRAIAGKSKYIVPPTNKTEAMEIPTTNLFLEGGEINTYSGKIVVDKIQGVFGGKTGTTDKEKATMVVGCDIDGLETYAVILDSTTQERYNDVAKLLRYARENLNPYSAVEEGEIIGTAKILGGRDNKIAVCAAATGVINLPEGASASLVTLEPKIDELKAPVEAGTRIGTVDIFLADDYIRTVDVLAAESMEEGWFLSGFGVTNVQTIIAGVVIFLILLLIIVILRLRAINRRKKKARRQAMLRKKAMEQMAQEADWAERGWTDYTRH